LLQGKAFGVANHYDISRCHAENTIRAGPALGKFVQNTLLKTIAGWLVKIQSAFMHGSYGPGIIVDTYAGSAFPAGKRRYLRLFGVIPILIDIKEQPRIADYADIARFFIDIDTGAAMPGYE